MHVAVGRWCGRPGSAWSAPSRLSARPRPPWSTHARMPGGCRRTWGRGARVDLLDTAPVAEVLAYTVTSSWWTPRADPVIPARRRPVARRAVAGHGADHGLPARGRDPDSSSASCTSELSVPACRPRPGRADPTAPITARGVAKRSRRRPRCGSGPQTPACRAASSSCSVRTDPSESPGRLVPTLVDAGPTEQRSRCRRRDPPRHGLRRRRGRGGRASRRRGGVQRPGQRRHWGRLDRARDRGGVRAASGRRSSVAPGARPRPAPRRGLHWQADLTRCEHLLGWRPPYLTRRGHGAGLGGDRVGPDERDDACRTARPARAGPLLVRRARPPRCAGCSTTTPPQNRCSTSAAAPVASPPSLAADGRRLARDRPAPDLALDAGGATLIGSAELSRSPTARSARSWSVTSSSTRRRGWRSPSVTGCCDREACSSSWCRLAVAVERSRRPGRPPAPLHPLHPARRHDGCRVPVVTLRGYQLTLLPAVAPLAGAPCPRLRVRRHRHDEEGR